MIIKRSILIKNKGKLNIQPHDLYTSDNEVMDNLNKKLTTIITEKYINKESQ